MRRVTSDRGATMVEYAIVIGAIVTALALMGSALADRGQKRLDHVAEERGLPTEHLYLQGHTPIVGGGDLPPPPPAVPTVHLAALDGAATVNNPNFWSATVVVRVETVDGGEPWSGVTVEGTWVITGSSTTTQTGHCTTTPTGVCTVTLSKLRRGDKSGSVHSVEFTPTVVTASDIVHSPQPGDPTTSGPVRQP